MTTEVEPQDASPVPGHHHPERSHRSWASVLGIMAATLALWMVLDATSLQHNAQVSPVGTRRTVALTFLNPLASTTRVLQIADLELAANDLLGRNGNVPGNGSTFSVVGPAHPSKAHKAPPKHSGHPGPVTVTTANPLAHPSAADPLRVLLVGDSLGLDLGGSLQNSLAATGVVTATLDGKEATGLTRSDYFNWPQELSSDLGTVHPQVIVVMMGANDPQDFLGPPDVPFGTTAWNTEYTQRVVSFMQLATSTGSKLIWVSLPPMQDPGLNAKVQVINLLQRSAAAQVPRVLYVDSSTVVGSTYSAFTVVNGQVVNTRTPDGIHITPEGGSLLATAVMAEMHAGLGINLP
jgi:hypothetical protein